MNNSVYAFGVFNLKVILCILNTFCGLKVWIKMNVKNGEYGETIREIIFLRKSQFS